MPRAVLNDLVLADSPTTVNVEGNQYFPPESVNWDNLEKSRTKTVCPWKGIASYHDAADGSGVIKNVAWSYPHPSPFARRIRGHVAFGPLVSVERSPNDPEVTRGRGRVRRRSSTAS